MASLTEVQSAIRGSGLSWEAGTTPVGEAFERGDTRAFGFAPKGREPSGGRGSLPSTGFRFATGPLPTKLDWRKIESDDFVTHVGDQGRCGACVAFATCAVLESRLKIQKKNPNFEVELSKAHLFFCGTENGCETGWMPGSALARCRKVGVGLERDFRYARKQVECKEIRSFVRVPRWRKAMTSDDRKHALLRGPVIGGMVVYDDFVWFRAGVYRPTTSAVGGLHCVAVIGFDDEKSCWTIKNSWGTAWGEGGFGRIGYGTCGLDSQFPFYDPAVELVESS
jgi:C1A family cysteine protease